MNLNDIINEARFIDVEMQQPPAVITIQGKVIATKGNFISINGLPKNYKSTIMGFFIYSAISNKSCFDIEVKTNGGNIVLIDTEQGLWDFSNQMKRIKFLLKSSLPNRFKAFTFRRYDPAIILNAIEQILINDRPDVLFIDNLTELVMNPNDMIEAKEITQRLKKWTSDHETVIVNLLHLGKTNFNSLGNLGSYIDRAVQSSIKVSYDKEQQGILVEPSLMRSDRHFNPILIRYDEETNQYTQGESEQKEIKSRKFILNSLTASDHVNRLSAIFISINEITYSELVEEIKRFYGVGTNIAKQQIIPFLSGNGFLRSDKGIYKLAK